MTNLRLYFAACDVLPRSVHMLSAAQDDRLGNLIGVEVVLPAQFGRPARCGARDSSTHRLMLGVLRDAVDLYCRAADPGRRVTPRERREVRSWFESRDRRWLFSFERICEALDLDSDYVRRGLHTKARRFQEALLVHAR
jgi:hypothetical protein